MVSPRFVFLITMKPEYQREWVALMLKMLQAPTTPDTPNSSSTWWTGVESFKKMDHIWESMHYPSLQRPIPTLQNPYGRLSSGCTIQWWNYPMWYWRDSKFFGIWLTNSLSLALVRDNYNVSYDYKVDIFTIHTLEKYINFHRSHRGL